MAKRVRYGQPNVRDRLIMSASLIANRGEIACAYCAPAANWVCERSPCIRKPTPRRNTSSLPTNQSASDRPVVAELPQHSRHHSPLPKSPMRSHPPRLWFLSETPISRVAWKNPALPSLARALKTIRLMATRSTQKPMREAGVPCVPGSEAPADDPKEITKIGRAVGYPVIIQGPPAAAARHARGAYRSGVAQRSKYDPQRGRSRLQTIPRCIWRSSSKIRAMWRSRSSPTPIAIPSIWASATVPCSRHRR